MKRAQVIAVLGTQKLLSGMKRVDLSWVRIEIALLTGAMIMAG